MTDNNKIRSGSLQFYPRVRAKKTIPRANWKAITSDKPGLLGFLGYKVGMTTVMAIDETKDSMTKSKKIAIPSTILECPPMKIYSIRFYNREKVSGEIVLSKEKILKGVVRLPKEIGKIEGEFPAHNDIRLVLYSENHKTCTDKKKPDLIEIGLSGSLEEKINYAREKAGKEVWIDEVFEDGLLDVHGVTRGLGTMGPVRRFGISLKSHKSEKGRRRPGSLAPWNPPRVTFRAPQAGQTGYHSRVVYNLQILEISRIDKKNINPSSGFKNYGIIKTAYIILRGSVPGPKKRGLLLTPSFRPSKKQIKKKYTGVEIV